MESPATMLFRNVRLQAPASDTGRKPEDLTVSVIVEAQGLTILEPGGTTRQIDFGQVDSLWPIAYQLEITLADSRIFRFSQLGHEYEPFLFQVYTAWNEFVCQALFIDEPCLLETKGDYAFSTPGNPLLKLPASQSFDQYGETRFRLYDSSLAVLPARGPIRRLPLCFITDLRREQWQIKLATDYGDQLILIRLGHDTDAMFTAISQAVQRQTDRAASLLQQVFETQAPLAGAAGFEPVSKQGLQAAAWHLREGRSADLKILEQACPGLARRLDLLLRQWSKDGYYQRLLALSGEQGIAGLSAGIRREQWTDSLGKDNEEQDETNDEAASTLRPVFWLAVPIRSAIVIESIAEGPLAQATYVFGLSPDPALQPRYHQVINQGLEAVDFRRQPIYLPLEKLSQPACRRDLAALRFCPSLAFLRAACLGRAIHRDPDSWQSSLLRLIEEGQTNGNL